MRPDRGLFLGVLSTSLLAWLALACGDEPISLEPTYANVERVVRRSCALSSSCHGGSGRGEARLNFQAALRAREPITSVLVGIRACEYDLMPIVDPGNPDNSWLMVKLDGPHNGDGEIQIDPDPEWNTGLEPKEDGLLPRSTCPLTTDGALSFGLLMPRSLTRPFPLERGEIEMFREWIRLGAPGPD